ncbi:MAG: DUF72 domain-containing protein [Planctomycetota bacterium]
MIYVGTSGYSYDDWVGNWYPPGTTKREMLGLYAKRFNATELNFTYYRLPSARTIEAICRKLPGDFRLFAKANSETTHKRNREAADEFKRGLEPARQAGMLGGILAQFPYSFRNSQTNRDYLNQLAEDFAGYNLVVEFRNRGWSKMSTLDLLRELGLGLCCVDEPYELGLMPPVAEATTDTAYVRFHSRDKEKWYGGDAKERYHYLYTEDELAGWTPKVRKLDDISDSVYVFFNNCHAGHAAVNAEQFQDMLRDVGLLVR